MRRYTPLLLGCPLALAVWAQIAIADHGVWSAQSVVGLAILVPAFLLWTLARHQLGDSFTPKAEARRLVTNGLYARIQHPIYLFAECTVLGIIVFFGLPVLVLVWVPAAIWQIRRARNERRVLEDAFGDQYRRYRNDTWF
jgi:protein-S-isoprenylcysteine O-methyltransferase Ste14